MGQLILQGQPLTNEEIAAMTGQGGASAAVPVQTTGASFAMPDMFSSPGLTNVYAATGQSPPVASTVVETAAAASTVVEPTAPATTASAKKEKKSSKNSSKKKLSSKKKEKGCC